GLSDHHSRLSAGPGTSVSGRIGRHDFRDWMGVCECVALERRWPADRDRRRLRRGKSVIERPDFEPGANAFVGPGRVAVLRSIRSRRDGGTHTIAPRASTTIAYLRFGRRAHAWRSARQPTPRSGAWNTSILLYPRCGNGFLV